jgi:hypothetical protein
MTFYILELTARYEDSEPNVMPCRRSGISAIANLPNTRQTQWSPESNLEVLLDSFAAAPIKVEAEKLENKNTSLLQVNRHRQLP